VQSGIFIILKTLSVLGADRQWLELEAY